MTAAPVKALIDATGPSPGSLGPGQAAALTPVGNRPIVHHGLDSMRRAGIRDVGVVAAPALRGPLEDAVGDGRRWGMRIEYVDADETTGLGGVLDAAVPFLGSDPFVLHAADGVLGDDLEPIVDQLAATHVDALLLARSARRRTLGPPLDLVGGEQQLNLAGLHLFGPGFLERLRGTGAHRAWRRAPEIADIDRAGGRVEVRVVAGWRDYAGDPEELLELNRLVLDRVVDETTERGDGNDIGGRVAIHPSARVESSVIRGPVVIGAGAWISDSYIGPYTSVGNDVRVAGAELEQSILFDGASVLHVGHRLECCLVGQGARVTRQFALPRALRLNLRPGSEVAFS